jgi:orotidine-5'-phosphate decarboxylase
MPSNIPPRERLIVALDMPDVVQAQKLVDEIGDGVSFYKVGMELAYGGGLEFVTRLADSGKKVFLDLKLHDIPHTVERAVAQVARLGATFLTIHAYPQTMRAAVAGRAGSNLKLLGVSVLTSSDDADLKDAGYAYGVSALVARRGAQARAADVDGLVASAAETAMLRARLGDDLLLVIPGIRPAGAENADQKRVATPAQAIRDGADYLVVGRPVTQAPDPRAAAQSIAAEIAGALR